MSRRFSLTLPLYAGKGTKVQSNEMIIEDRERLFDEMPSTASRKKRLSLAEITLPSVLVNLWRGDPEKVSEETLIHVAAHRIRSESVS